MRGLMQDHQLTVDRILDHARTWHGDREIVARNPDGSVARSTYAQLHATAKRVSAALLRDGIAPGDRVATLGWNATRHVAAWYGIASIGAVCHTLNPRLFTDQLVYIAGHAGDRLLFADPATAPLVATLLAQVPSIERVVFLGDEAALPPTDYPAMAFDAWLAPEGAEADWGRFDENTACGLCYTSGTTGNPKGVLYSHRSNYLHTLLTLQADALALSARDTVLLIVPMYHANAWGVVYSAPAVGAKLVLPGAQMDGASLHRLIEEEVSYSAAVPTVWQTLLAYMKANDLGFSTLQRVTIGGSACPEALVRTLRDDYGVTVNQGWGMTETSPLATVSTPTAAVAAMPIKEQVGYAIKQGRLIFGMEFGLVDDAGSPVPHDGTTPGRLLIRGDTIAAGYFGGEGGDILDAEGFFDTGDIATIDGQGFMHITDRAKDIVKSGGEWISSIDIENVASGHPKVLVAAVVGVAHPKWDERPILLVQLRPGESAEAADIRDFLRGRIANWWMPDDILIVDEVPLGATGKIDKKRIRQQLTGYALPFDSVARSAT